MWQLLTSAQVGAAAGRTADAAGGSDDISGMGEALSSEGSQGSYGAAYGSDTRYGSSSASLQGTPEPYIRAVLTGQVNWGTTGGAPGVLNAGTVITPELLAAIKYLLASGVPQQ
jgi:hypothetical protein